MSAEPTDPPPPNTWFAAEHDFDSNQPVEAGVTEVSLEPSDSDAMQRLLRALRKL